MSDISANPAGHHADKEALKDKAAGVKDAVVDLAAEAKDFAAAQATGAYQASKARVVQVGDKTVDYIQRNPYQALAIAAGIGFVAGLILKRR